MQEIKLSKAIHVNGVEVSSLPYDFESMTAMDKIAATRHMTSMGFPASNVEELEPVYHLFLFSVAVEVATRGNPGEGPGASGRVTVQDVLRISAKDAQKAGELARDFFYLSDD